MTIQFVGGTHDNAPNGGNLSLDLRSLSGGIASSCAQYDVVVVLAASGALAAASIATAGYTVIANLATNAKGVIAWKRMGATPDTSVAIDGGGSFASGVAARAYVFRGVDVTTAIDAATTSASGSSTTPDSPPITTVSNGAAVISLFASQVDDAAVTGPTGYSNAVSTDQSGTNDITIGLAWKTVATAGAEDPPSWSNVQTGHWDAYSVALRPLPSNLNASLSQSIGAITLSAAATGAGVRTATLAKSIGDITLSASATIDTDVKDRFLGSGSVTGHDNAALAIPVPAGVTDGNYLLAQVTVEGLAGSPTVTPPAGWTQLYYAAGVGGVWWRAASAEPGSYSFAIASGGSSHWSSVGAIEAYTNLNSGGAPIVGSIGTGTGITVTLPGIVADITTARLVAIVLAGQADTGNATIKTGITGWRTRITINDSNRVDNSHKTCAGLSVQDYPAVSVGATGDFTAALRGSGQTWHALILGLPGPLDSLDTALTAGGVPIVDLTVWDEDAQAAVIKRYAGTELIFSDGTAYEARLKSGVTAGQSAADVTGIGGQAASTFSQLVLDNADSALDDIVNKSLASGRSIVIRVIEPSNNAASDLGWGASASSAPVFISGVVAAMQYQGTDVILSLSDLWSLLNVPLQSSVYDGSAGLGGDVELAGLPKPMALGYCYNVTPVPLGNVDLGFGSLLTYQYHSRLSGGAVRVRIRGVSQGKVFTTPGVGQFVDIASSGVFQLGSSPDGEVTADVNGDAFGGFVQTTGAVVQRLLEMGGGAIDTTLIDTQSMSDVDSVLTGVVGIYFGPQVTTHTQAVMTVLQHAALALSVTRSGKFRLSFPDGQDSSLFELDEPQIAHLQPVAMASRLLPSPTTVQARYGHNFTVLSNPASSLSASDLRALTNDGGYAQAASALISARQKPKPVWTLPGLFANSADALVRAQMLQAWLERGLQAFQVTTGYYRSKVEIGQVMHLKSYSRYDLSGGFTAVIVGWSEDPHTGLCTMTLIGAKDAV